MHQPAPGVRGVHGHQKDEDGELGAGEVVRKHRDVRDPTLRRGRVPAYGKYVAVLICRIQRVLQVCKACKVYSRIGIVACQRGVTGEQEADAAPEGGVHDGCI